MKKLSMIFICIVFILSFTAFNPGMPVVQATPPARDLYEAYPPFLAASVPPLVMLVMGKNHKLYYEAYNDASDLNGDGELDVGYNPAIEYYGYFDSYKSYTYNSTTGRFEPSSISMDKKTNATNEWSGDFLNYLTMSRMDTLRKVLYGGYRSDDTASLTVLERAFIPQDSHAWGKEYYSINQDGYDIRDYTPFNLPIGPSRHLFANATKDAIGNPPMLRVLENSAYRIWNWVAREVTTVGNTLTVDGSDVPYTTNPTVAVSADETNAGAAGTASANPAGSPVLVSGEDLTNGGATGTVSDIWVGTPDPASEMPPNAFDDSASTKWLTFGPPEGNPLNVWIQFKFNTAQRVVAYTLTTANDAAPRDPKAWQLQASSDGSTWTTIDTVSNGNLPDTRFTKSGTFVCDTPIPVGTTYEYYRLYITERKSTNTSNLCSSRQCVQIAEIELIGTQEITDSPAALAFDDDDNTVWFTTAEPLYNPVWIQFAFTAAKAIKSYTITTGNGDEDMDPRSWTFEASQDGSIWVVLDTVVDGGLPAGRQQSTSFDCDTEPATPYTYYRLKITGRKGAGGFGTMIAEIELFENTESIPLTATASEYIVRVEVANATTGLEPNCKRYPNGNYKPIGLLQRHGESDGIYFGLLSGSYAKNMSGGVLRKNISSIKDEINYASDGTFTAVNGIIKTLDAMRIYGYDYGSHKYCCLISDRPMDEGEFPDWGNPIGEMMYETLKYFAGDSRTTAFDYSSGGDVSLGLPKPAWQDPYDTFAYCSKPFMLVLSDVNPTFDSDQLPGANAAYFSGSSPEAIGDANSELNVETLANVIFSNETNLTSGDSYYIGQSGADSDRACTAKAVNGFGDVRGLCPEEPTKQGSYYSASVAYYGRTVPLRDPVADQEEGQTIRTYAVGLASPLPNIEIQAAGEIITLLPFGKKVSTGSGIINGTSGNGGEGGFQPTMTIADFFVESIGPTAGTFRVNFEDAEQGNDFDMDAVIRYNYQVYRSDGTTPATSLAEANEAGATVKVNVECIYANMGHRAHMGFIISGTTEGDGIYLVVRDTAHDQSSDANYDYFLDTPPGQLPGGNWNDDIGLPDQQTHWFTPNTASEAATLIPNPPLYYAAKYGGFEDQNGDAMPDPDGDEWDKDGDGVPDTYYYVTNPLKLERELNKSFADILEKAASGTSASVLATNSEGEGNLIQAYFEPKRTTESAELTWLGYLQSLWVDPCGNLREDSDGDLQLDRQNVSTGNTAVGADKIVEFITDTDGDTKIILYTSHYLYNPDNGDNCTCILEQLVPDQECPDLTNPDNYDELAIEGIHPLFEAGALLSERDASTRKIFTFIDGNGIDDDGDGLIDESGEPETGKAVGQVLNTDPGVSGDDPFDNDDELILFHTDNVNRLKPFLGVNNDSCDGCSDYLSIADDSQRAVFLIDYIRGKDQSELSGYAASGLRPRMLGNGDVWKLGDIVNSTPVSVSKPPDNFHIIYGDATYQVYYDAMRDRESVIYVGSNNGMLHAFTSWEYNGDIGKYVDPNLIAGEQIGDEIWAYIPQTLLPHLKWLADPEYAHSYYVDLKPKVFDAKIDVTGDGTEEWRTLMICGLNFGGKHIWATDDFGNGNVTRHFYPTFFCMDVTVPRSPRLLWERSYAGLGMTTSTPAIVKVGDSWFAIFGSGPNDDNGRDDFDGESDQHGHIFVVDVLTGAPFSIGMDDWLFETSEDEAWMNSPASIDYGLDYNVDGIYIGSTYKDFGGDWRGNIHKINTWLSTSPSANPADWSSSILFDGSSSGPITASVALSVDSLGNVWSYFGTGRYISSADKIDEEQQFFIGIKDPFFNKNTSYYKDTSTTLTLGKSNLFDSNDISVTTIRNVYTGDDCPPTCIPYGSTGTWNEFLNNLRDNEHGWYIDLVASSGTGSPSERVVSKASVLGGIVFYPGYIPNNDICGWGGDSSFYGLYFETGTAYPRVALPGGSVTATIDGTSQTIVGTRIELGSGAPPPATGFHVGQQEGAKAFLQMSTGQVIELDVETAFRIKSGLTFWRERN